MDVFGCVMFVEERPRLEDSTERLPRGFLGRKRQTNNEIVGNGGK